MLESSIAASTSPALTVSPTATCISLTCPLVLNPKQEREAKLLRKSVLKHFQHLEDPRAERGRNHSLVSIIAIAILAVLADADGFVAIEAYGQSKQSWLETFLDLPNGIGCIPVRHKHKYLF
jgi:hypothetical protein